MKHIFWAVVLASFLLVGCGQQLSKKEPCLNIKASDPVVVRPEGVGGNDSTDLGRIAFSPHAVSTDAGVLAVWDVSFDGQRPEPNLYMRFLDHKLQPVGEVSLLFERNSVWGPGKLVSAADKVVFSYCGRHYDRDHLNSRDLNTIAFLDPYGHLISEQVLASPDRYCSVGAQAIWTGSRMLFSSASSRVSVPDRRTLDITDAKGNSISWRRIDSSWDPTSPFAIGHKRVFLVAGDKTELVVYRLDSQGNEWKEPVRLAPISYEVDGRMVMGEFRSSYVIPAADGWLVLASFLNAPGIYVVRLAPDGSKVSEPFVTRNDIRLLDESFFIRDAIPYRGGAVLLMQKPDGYNVTSVVFFISDDGTITATWSPRQGEQPVSGSFFEHQAQLFIIYTTENPTGKLKTNQVLVRELQCVP
jgi:hypothetical protein